MFIELKVFSSMAEYKALNVLLPFALNICFIKFLLSLLFEQCYYIFFLLFLATSKEKSKKEPARKVAKSPEEAEIKKQNATIQEDDSKTKSVKNIKKNAKKANAAMNTHFDAKKKPKKEQAATSSMATTAAVDEEETTEDTTTENGRAVIDEMTASSDIDKRDTKDISLNKHVSENKEKKLHFKLNETPVSTK